MAALTARVCADRSRPGFGNAISSRTRCTAEQPRIHENQSAHAVTLVRWIALLATMLALTACGGGSHLSFLNPQGPVADAQRWHFYEVLAVMAILVAGPIFLLLPLFVWRYRYGKQKPKYTPKWDFSQLLEIAAWGGPIVIVAVLSFFVWRDTHKLDPYKPLTSKQAPLRVQVIGYDWKWMFIYPDQGIASIGTLALPTNRPVSMHITSATVMQSLFIPALGSQIYAMGGMVSQLNLQASKTGKSMGENTMYNGNGFHHEQFTAVGMTPAHFKAWVRNVRAIGIPLNAQMLRLIERRGKRSDLVASLPPDKVNALHGNVYLTNVKKTLFPAVVKAIMDGNKTLPESAFAHAHVAPRGADNAAHFSTEHTR